MRYGMILLRLFHLIVLLSPPPFVVHGWTISVIVPEDGEVASVASPANDEGIVKLISVTRTTATFQLKFGGNMTADRVTSVRLGYRPEREVLSPPTLEWNEPDGYHAARGTHTIDDSGSLEYFRSNLTIDRVEMVVGLRFPATKYRFTFEYYRDNVPVGRVALLASTLPDLPAPPKTGPGCFHVYEVRQTGRTVKVFWQKVLDEEVRVDIRAYKDGSGALVHEHIGYAARLGYVWLDLSLRGHRIVLTTVNEVGCSRTSSIVWIPAQADVLPAPKVSVLVNEMKPFDVVSLSWTKPIGVNATNYTVATIEATNFTSPVNVDDFVYLPATDEIMKFHVAGNGSQRFAVSVNAGTASSGLQDVDFGHL